MPFTVTPFEARATFDAHHSSGWLYKRPSGGEELKHIHGSTGSLLQGRSWWHAMQGSARLAVGRPAGLQRMKEAFLPFWVSSADVRSALHSAEIGHERWTEVCSLLQCGTDKQHPVQTAVTRCWCPQHPGSFPWSLRTDRQPTNFGFAGF